MQRKTIAISLLGTVLDFAGKRWERWHKWRPNIGLCSQPDLKIDELYLMYDNHSLRLAETVKADIAEVAAHTQVVLQNMNFKDPWDFEEVYAKLFDWCREFTFEPDKHDYLFHITTGTHVVQICSFLLTESRHFPGRIIQTSPSKNSEKIFIGRAQVIDLDLSNYEQLATRFDIEHEEGKAYLKSGIQTKNEAFNQLMSEIEKAAIRSNSPILLTGPSGAGKSQLATKIYELKKRRNTVSGPLVVVNCAALKSENAKGALFGFMSDNHSVRDGFLQNANKGLLFLDEISELGLEEQAMLLHAIEHKAFYPLGSHKTVESDFQLIAATKRNLAIAIQKGTFREDLLASLNLWTYELPALKHRQADIPANIEYELELFAKKHGQRIQFNKDAKEAFIEFAESPKAVWTGNFRDLNSAITRLCTLADASGITLNNVQEEIARLKLKWEESDFDEVLTANGNSILQDPFIGDNAVPVQVEKLDEFDRYQLGFVINECRKHPSMAAAGRALFNVSRQSKTSNNDSSRLQKYLAKFGLKWSDLS